MATFGDMITWVSKRLQDPSNTAVSSSDVGDLINQAMDYWQNSRFWFNEATDDPNSPATLTQQNASVPMPADFLVPSIDNWLVIQYSGIRYPLKKVSEQQYNNMYLSNGIGQPFWFSKQATQQYQVYPIPDQNYSLLRFWLRDYPPFVNNSDENEFSDNAANLLKYTAAAYGSRDFRQDLNMYEVFMQQAKLEYNSLMVTTRKDNATGSLAISSILQ